MTVNCPGTTMEITPAHMHMHLLVLLRAGMLSTMTVGEPGTQGAGVFGMQGMGVRTPQAAAVAAATVGFARLMHIPKGRMLTMGAWSMMLAAGWLPAIVRWRGRTIKVDGAMPKVHARVAVLTVSIGMAERDYCLPNLDSKGIRGRLQVQRRGCPGQLRIQMFTENGRHQLTRMKSGYLITAFENPATHSIVL